MRPGRPNGPRSRPWATACVAVLVFACLAAVACDRSTNEAGWMVSIQLERADNGRVVLSGRTNAPDGLWVYVETVGDPQRMQALAGEAIVVRGGTFSWVTP
ncbi:hypothetical protein KDL45_10335, partial [bacterium]|nr:hypothetical protein [bacterium]